MRAAQINQYGDPSVIQINDVDKPTPGPGQVLIEVHASNVNPFDAKLRAGYMQDRIPLQFPFTIGGDVAGVVTELGEGVDNLAVGDKVYGNAARVAGNSGAIAEYTVTKASQIAKAPANLDFIQTGSLPLVGVSALQALSDELNLQPDQKIFITGGAGGIGSIAIQIAKHIGAHVATTATDEGIEFAKQLGADEVIDYKAQDYTKLLHDFDAVFDTVGDNFTKTLNVLKRDGNAVSMIASTDGAKASELGVSAKTQATHITTEILDRLRELVESGHVTPQVGKVFKFDEVQQAYEAWENGSVHGKVVIQIKD